MSVQLDVARRLKGLALAGAIVACQTSSVSALGATPSSGPAVPLIPACTASWRVVDSQNGPWSNGLDAVTAISPTDMWAVGHATSPLQQADQILTEHWDGSTWSYVAVAPGPFVPTNGVLSGVGAAATDDVWAVGQHDGTGIGTHFVTHPIAFHWNGGAWAIELADAHDGGFTAVSVVATDDAWAVGHWLQDDGLGGLVARTLIEHWNGTGWSTVASPNAGSDDSYLLGVAADGASDVWAVGYSSAAHDPASARSSLIEHWDGTSWSIVPSPTVAYDSLLAVAAASPTSAFAVGFRHVPGVSFTTIQLKWDGSTWTDQSASQPDPNYNILDSVTAVSSTDYWASGYFQNSATGTTQPFGDHWDGASWTTQVGISTGTTDQFFGVTAGAPGDVWAVGGSQRAASPDRNLIENFSGLKEPTGVTATAGDQSASVSWNPPCGDGGSTITSYMVTAHDGCTIQGSTSVAGTSASFTGLTNGNRYTFTVAAVNAFGRGPESAESGVAVPFGSPSAWVSACDAQQHQLAGSDGTTWTDIDPVNLFVSFTPAADSFAVVSGNADLWTEGSGYNQDIGVSITGGGVYPTLVGQPEAWKESGGFAGTFSPNAAYVQTVIPVLASTTYTARLQWKTNKPDPGRIFAGAGPVGPAFSPTRLTVRLIPRSAAIVFTASSMQQYRLAGSDGSAWTDVDATNLSVRFTPPAGTWTALVSGNADLWTSSSRYNQDIGVTLSGGVFPTIAGQPEAWKESGGFAGTYSPNAAFVQASLQTVLAGSTTYTAKLQWKANKIDPGSIWAGAGPIGGHFSPTTLTVILTAPTSAATRSVAQYRQSNSDGAYWQAVDEPTLEWSLAPTTDANYEISAGADLWTSVAGLNQDLGIMVSGGAYGTGTLVAWKESGGYAGTFSPNAAFVSTDLHLQSGFTYVVWTVWKANRGSYSADSSNAVYAGAGPINGHFSPTTLTAVPLS